LPVVLRQIAKGLIHLDERRGTDIDDALDSTKWYLWHGKVQAALNKLDDVSDLVLDFEESYPKYRAIANGAAKSRGKDVCVVHGGRPDRGRSGCLIIKIMFTLLYLVYDSQ
jgi:hypothetical protein